MWTPGLWGHGIRSPLLPCRSPQRDQHNLVRPSDADRTVIFAGLRMESTPAIELDRTRSVGNILRSTLQLYSSYPWLFWTLALAVMLPWDLAKLAITGVGPFGHAPHEGFLEHESLQLFGATLIVALISALHVHAIVAIGEGQRPRLGSVAWSGVRVLPIVGAAAIIADVGTELGFFALLIPGIVLWIRLIVVAQAAAIERAGVRPALRRSWQLTRGHEWHVLGLILVVGVLVATVSVGAFLLTTGSGTSAGAVALGIVVNTVLASFSALTTALLYFDLRSRQEETQAIPAVVSP